MDSISVPVNQPLTLYVIISQPAPQGGLYFELSSEDTDIVAAGDETQAFLPEVFIPEGETVSGPFEIFGIQTGSTNLDILPEDSDYSTSSTPTTAWSVNPDPDGDPQFTVFLDANASYNDCRSEDDPATLSSDPSVLSSCGGNVQGTVSDGVSQLLLRTVAGLAGTACYAISSTSDLDQGSISTAVAATQGGDDDDDFQYAFSFYQAPAEYGDTSQSRGVDVIFSFTPSLGNGNTSTISTCSGCDLPSLTIIRPPVLLIHGIWSSKLTWNQGNWFRSGSYYVTKTMNYQGTNASSFSVNFPAVQTAVKSGLDAVHDLGAGFAATQVDVVGHSMGGLLTRLYAESDNFERPDNFDEGDIRRLVTLDTPHFGASLANMVVSLTKNSVVFRALGDLLSGIRGLGFDVPVFNQGAVCDLAENSPALQDLADGTDLASQVITAQGGPQPPPTPRKFWAPLEFALTLRVPFYVFPQNVVNDFRFLSNNDTIVPISSQLGGLAFDSDDDFPPDIHTNVEHDSSVSAQAFDLLDGLSGDFSDSLPGVPSNGLGNPLTVPGRGMALDQSDYASECRPGGPLNPASDASSERLAGGSQPDNAGTTPALVSTASAPVGDPRVQIARPANNQQFAPGDTVNVTLQLTAPLTASAAFIAPEVAGLGPLLATGASGDSYKASFVIPNTFAGPLVIAPAILDSNQNPIRGVTTTIDVVPPGAPSGLILAGGNYTHLPSAPASDSIDVTGIYPDGVQLNLTSSVTGTTYASSNPDVLTVDANGNVNVLASGTASVAVENGSQKAFSTFVVENSAKPLPPQDVTARVRISESGFQLNRSTGFFVQTVQLSNSTSFPIVGPLYFVLSDLPSGVTLISNSGGKTQTIPPARTPFIRLKLADGFTLQPGANVSLTLQFLDQSRTRINYTPKVFRKLGTP